WIHISSLTTFYYQLFILCRLCIDFYWAANQFLEASLLSDRKGVGLLRSFRKFFQVFFIVFYLKQYFEIIFLIMMGCNLCILTLLFYITFYHPEISVSLRVTHLVMAAIFISLIVFFSYILGRINDESKKMSEFVYFRVNVE